MNEVTMGRSVTREINIHQVNGEHREPVIRAVRVERVGHPALVLPLYPDVEYVFGRSGDSSVVFTDDAVSRQHGRLWCDAQLRWVYRDLSSSNGTYRNPRSQPDARFELKGSTPVPLSAGDELWLGTERARLVFLETAPQGTSHRPPKSEAARALEQRVVEAAHHELPVVLMGPSGAGKTHVARRIHDLSHRKGQFILVNCGRLPRDTTALQSELLGHVRGAFTGAEKDRMGKFFAAATGTLFLDEVECLPREAQDFLIDVLEGSGVFAPLGAAPDARPEAPRFRLISATKTPLRHSRLRPDLVERLLGDAITLPSLEDRRDDIPALVKEFLDQLHSERNLDAEITPEGLALLLSRPWPGHVRELKRVIDVTTERLAAGRRARGLEPDRLVVGVEALTEHFAGQDEVLGVPVLGDEPAPTEQFSKAAVRDLLDRNQPLRKRPADLTRAEVDAALAAAGGNKTRAAKALGIALNTLKAKLRLPG